MRVSYESNFGKTCFMLNEIVLVGFYLLTLIYSVIIHEVSHGVVALWLGDMTAKYAGRLNLNPIKHIDPFGSVILPLLSIFLGGPLFGWAKPVPYNPYNLRNQKWGSAIVGFAGPGINFSLALLAGLTIRFLPAGGDTDFFGNFVLIAAYVALINLFLCVFNLIPIPPLDGSKVLFSVLSYRWNFLRVFLEQYGFFLLLIFIFFFSGALIPLVSFFFEAITGEML